MESVLLETMYKIPSEQNVSKVVIDEAVIRGESEPLLMYENNDAVDSSLHNSQQAPKDKQSSA